MGPKPNYKAIEKIRLKTHWRGKLLSNLEPKTTLAAKFSMEHILATSIYHGSANVDAFNSETLNNQDIKELRDKVDMYYMTQNQYHQMIAPRRSAFNFLMVRNILTSV